MNWKLFIARRIYKDNEGGKEVSKPAIRIAMAGIAIGLAVMIISVAVVIGFKHQVRDNLIAYLMLKTNDHLGGGCHWF